MKYFMTLCIMTMFIQASDKTDNYNWEASWDTCSGYVALKKK